MAGVYGRLDSRVDFYRVLDEALATARHYLALEPTHPLAGRVAAQLEAMKHATRNERTPSDEERGRITLGVIALRELNGGATGDPRSDAWAAELTELASFFEGWPSDAVAAHPPADELRRLMTQQTLRKYGPSS